MKEEKSVWVMKLPPGNEEEAEYREAAFQYYCGLLEQAEPHSKQLSEETKFAERGWRLDYLLLQGLTPQEIDVLKQEFTKARRSVMLDEVLAFFRFPLISSAPIGVYFHWWEWPACAVMLALAATSWREFDGPTARRKALSKLLKALFDYSPHYYDPLPEWRERKNEPLKSRQYHPLSERCRQVPDLDR